MSNTQTACRSCIDNANLTALDQRTMGSSPQHVVYRGERFSERMAQRFEPPAAPLRRVPRPHTRLIESMTAILLAALSRATTSSNSVSCRCSLTVNSISITPHFLYW